MNLAPVILFVYNRPYHTEQTIKSLKYNELSNDTELFIFSDGASNEEDLPAVKRVRELICDLSGFKEKTVIARSGNRGLADNIVDGVTEVIGKYGKAIIMEDDLVTSPMFLTFMNRALAHYENQSEVWHISGWNYPIDCESIQENAFLWRVMNCWGWATWKDRWAHFEKNTPKLIKSFSKQDIKEFNLDGTYNFWDQMIANKKGNINTWAIYWYATIFKNNGLCLNPAKSYVKNIGLDGSGVHCNQNISGYEELNTDLPSSFPNEVVENAEFVNRVKEYLLDQKVSLFSRAKNKIARILNFR